MFAEIDFSFLLLLKITACGFAVGVGFWAALFPLLMLLMRGRKDDGEAKKEWDRIHNSRATQIEMLANIAATLHALEVTYHAQRTLAEPPPSDPCTCDQDLMRPDPEEEDTHLL